MKKLFARFTVLILLAQPAISQAKNELIFHYESTKDLLRPIDVTPHFAEKNAFQLESGSLTLRMRNHSGDGVSSFFGVSDPKRNDKYINFYVHRFNKTDTFGIEIRDRHNLIENSKLIHSMPSNNAEFFTITYTFDDEKNQIVMYLDGKKVHSYQTSKFFADINGLSAAYLGKTLRHNYSHWQMTGDLYYADFSPQVLTGKEIKQKHKEIAEKHKKAIAKDQEKRTAYGAYRSVTTPLFEANENGAKNYRIPALLTTKSGVVIAAIDKRHQHANDWGNIDTAIRRSLDNGKTWEDERVILDLVSQPYGTENSAFLIDPLMVQDQTSGRIFLMMDMFPETKGFFGINKNFRSEGSGYQKIKGKHYRILRDEKNKLYTVREKGVVYDDNNQATDFRVVIEGDRSKAFRDLGDLYQKEQRLGNIFLQTTQKDHDTAPLKAVMTNYLWLTYSDDDGKTWSSPIDITPQVKADWMRFFGTAPGNGIQLKNGALVMPIYYTNSYNRQSAAVIISHDGGKTWERGESPNDSLLVSEGGSRLLKSAKNEITESQLIELDNGDLKLFSRNLAGKVRISTSKDSGYTWLADPDFDEELLDAYSQLSVIKYSKRINGKEYVIFANPHSSSRSRVNGKVFLGEIQADGSIQWKSTTTISPGSYAYNSLTELPNGDIGLLYEESPSKIQYVSFNLAELLWKTTPLPPAASQDTKESK